MEVRPLGILEMEDNAAIDRKILAVPARNPRYDLFHGMDDVQPHVRKEIEHFFEIYKELEEKVVKTRGWRDAEAAHAAILASRERYLGKATGS